MTQKKEVSMYGKVILNNLILKTVIILYFVS